MGKAKKLAMQARIEELEKRVMELEAEVAESDARADELEAKLFSRRVDPEPELAEEPSP